MAAFVRVFLKGLDPMIADWAPIIWWIAALTMIVGTVVGVAHAPGVGGVPALQTAARGIARRLGDAGS